MRMKARSPKKPANRSAFAPRRDQSAPLTGT
jgi:hypothetical protein